MGLKPDHWIRKMAHEYRMIEPFEEKQVRNGVVSYGLSSYGYDVRVAACQSHPVDSCDRRHRRGIHPLDRQSFGLSPRAPPHQAESGSAIPDHAPT